MKFLTGYVHGTKWLPDATYERSSNKTVPNEGHLVTPMQQSLYRILQKLYSTSMDDFLRKQGFRANGWDYPIAGSLSQFRRREIKENVA